MNALFLLLVLAVFLGEGDANAAADSDKEVLQAIANGYVANRECVERCKATFVVMEGRAPNPEAARRGEIEDPVKAKGEYIYDGARKKFERLFDRDAIKSHTIPDPGGKLIAPCEFMSIQLLTDGRSTLRYVPSYNPFSNGFDKSAVIEGAEVSRFSESMSFPLDLGVKEPYAHGVAEQIEQASTYLKALKLDQDVQFEGRRVHVVACEFEGGDVTYWIDYKRGCIPLRILSRTDKDGVYSDEWYERVSLVGGKLWFPARTVLYRFPTHRVKILEVDTLQIDSVPADSDFDLSFPEPVSIFDTVHGRSYKNTASFGLSKLDHPDKSASRPIRITRSAPPPHGAPVLPGEIESSRSWVACLALSIASFLVLLVIYRVVRAKRGSHVGSL